MGRWMCHHLAELLNRAENTTCQEKDILRQACTDLIIKLWAHRATLPGNHHPWQNFNLIMEAIERLRSKGPFYYPVLATKEGDEPSGDIKNWLQIAEKVDSTAQGLVRICIDCAINCAGTDEKEWLEEGLTVASEKDLQARIIIELLGKAEQDEEKKPKDQTEIDAQRFEEFGEFCIEIAKRIRSKGPEGTWGQDQV